MISSDIYKLGEIFEKMRTKRKSESHIIEKNSLSIINDILPEYWSIREYKPDYGIDVIIELFEEKKLEKQVVYDTLGEHVFVQVKGIRKPKKSKIKVYNRNNIENEKLQEGIHYKEIEVFSFSIDTVELNTVQRMGSAIPVLLFLVDTVERKIFFVCLNDYIDKILIPAQTDYSNKKTQVIYIPTINEITSESSTLLPLYLYAKRPKYYALFSKIAYQFNEFNYCDEGEIIERARFYAKSLLYYDVWDQKYNWATLSDFHYEMQKFAYPEKYINDEKFDNTEKIWEGGNGDIGELFTEHHWRNSMRIRAIWHQLMNINNVFETMSREWFLPTYMFS